MAGYALAKYRFPGRELLFNIVLGGVLVPATALALPLFLIFSQVSLTNTFWAVFLPSLVSPFGVYLTRIFAAAKMRVRYTPNGLTRLGKNTAQNVLVRLTWLKIRNSGNARAVAGTSTPPSTMLKSSSRPGK